VQGNEITATFARGEVLPDPGLGVDRE